MNDIHLSRVWTAAGITGLAWLWIGVLWAPAWTFELGLAFLFFLAGFEIDFARIKGRPPDTLTNLRFTGIYVRLEFEGQ